MKFHAAFFKITCMEKKLAGHIVINIFLLCLLFSAGIILSCQSKVHSEKYKITVDIAMLDSVKKQSDSTYIKPYFTRDFATAEYFINRKDTTLTQVMKDKNSVIRQVIITKNNIRIFTAQYYSNGQLMAKYVLDKFGQYDGYSEEFYEEGSIKSSGTYKSGFHSGEWKNYNIDGKLDSKNSYDANGKLVTQ